MFTINLMSAFIKDTWHLDSSTKSSQSVSGSNELDYQPTKVGNFSKAPGPPWFHRPKDFFMIITFSNVNTRLPYEDLNQKPSCILPLWQHHFHNPRTTSSHPSHTSWRHWRHHSPAFPTSGKLVLLSSGLDNWQLNFDPLRGRSLSHCLLFD